MTIFLEPRTLHFGDTIATLAYVRADVPLRDNVVAIATAAPLMHGTYMRYAGERALCAGAFYCGRKCQRAAWP